MSIASIIAITLQEADGGLTLRQLVADIPHDPASFVVYAMLIASGWLIWKTNRRKKV